MSDRATALHQTADRGVFYVTGGGSPFLAELISTPGASNTVLDARVPYAFEALTELLGRAPEQACSATTALQLAMAGFEQARRLSERQSNTGGERLFGLGCSASLGTNRVKRGEHRAHWAVQTANATHLFYAGYEGDRASEERLLLDQLWASLGWALLGQDQPETLTDSAAASSAHQPLLDAPAYRWCSQQHDGRLIFPGSFNPIHHGHKAMLELAESITGLSGAYELSVHNADKPNLDFISQRNRLAAIDHRPVWLTNSPKFQDKAEQFPGCTFIIGVDTLKRVGERRFYNGSDSQMQAAFDVLHQQDCHFLVFGRERDGVFVTLDNLDLPDALRQRCQGVSEAQYRADISSTQLRMSQGS